MRLSNNNFNFAENFQNNSRMKNFTHTLFSLAALALLSSQAVAQSQSRTQSQRKTPASSALTPHATKQGTFRLLSVQPKADTTLPFAEYGEVVDFVNEDFSKMTTGSVGNPDTGTDINYENEDNAWINMSGDYTQMFGWGSHSAFPAGGTLYIEQQGNVNTPLLDLSGNDQMVIIQFDAFTGSASETSSYTQIGAAETNNMGPTWEYLGTEWMPTITSEKTTFTYLFYGAGATTLINISPQDASIYVDNIHVYQIRQNVGTPASARHRYYMGEDFNLVWSKVSNADSYVINLYTLDEEGEPQFLLQDFDTNSSDTTYNVTGATSGATYYYTIQGRSGTRTSIESQTWELYDVAAPVLNPVNEIADGHFTATWAPVPSAERYNYTALYARTATEDGEMTLTDFHFPGMKYNEGTLIDDEQAEPSYTVDNADYHSFSEAVLQDLPQAGWTARNYAVYKDALTIDGFYYYWSGDICSLESPEFDLSKNNGEFTVSTSLCAEYLQSYDAYPRSMIALFNYDKETDDFVQTESWYISDLNSQWKDYSHTFTQGSERSILSVFAVYAPGNIYLQDLSMKQNYKKGETFLDPFYSQQYVDTTMVNVPVSNYQKIDRHDVYHTAQSVRTPNEQDPYASSYKRVYSDWSTPKLVASNITGISHTALNSKTHATLTVDGEQIVVNNPTAAPVRVYTLGGVQVSADLSGAAQVRLPMSKGGTYIVRVGSQTIKLAM